MSRLSSDTQVVQDGLSTSVTMFVKAACICLAMVIVMFTYSWKLTLYALLLITPSLISNRIFMHFFRSYQKRYQDAKADMGSVAQETFSNVRTVKAFADEKGSVRLYNLKNDNVYQIGKVKSYIWGGFMFTYNIFRSGAFAAILFIVG